MKMADASPSLRAGMGADSMWSAIIHLGRNRWISDMEVPPSPDMEPGEERWPWPADLEGPYTARMVVGTSTTETRAGGG